MIRLSRRDLIGKLCGVNACSLQFIKARRDMFATLGQRLHPRRIVIAADVPSHLEPRTGQKLAIANTTGV